MLIKQKSMIKLEATMFFSRTLPLFLSFIFILISHHLTFAQPDFLTYYCVDDNGNYTANSTYKANLNHLLSTLTTDHPNIDYGFYNFSYGQDHDKANAIGLCRGDVTPYICRRCLNDSISLLTLICPNQKEAIGWYNYCMLRYSSRSLFGFMEDFPGAYMWADTNASDPVLFTHVAENFIGNLIMKAASGSSRLKFATGNRLEPNLPMMYGVVQCTPDLSEKECSDCLNSCLRDIRTCCDGKLGGNVMTPSCNFVYGVAAYFGSTLPPQPPPPPSTSTSISTSTPIQTPLVSNRSVVAEGNRSNKSRTVVVIVVSIIVSLVAVGLIISIYLFLRSRKPWTDKAKDLSDDEITNVESLHFDINTIRNATNMFSDANKLGQGGFGAVYKGSLPDGREIAVKRLSQFSTHGDAEFKNEVLLVAKLQHRNLAQLLGFCLKENEKLLIYEFVQNSSLEKFIFDPVKRIDLDWERRYKIIDDIVRGLVYLHQDSRLKIIHRDLKTSNILLDGKMNAKISDFGTAKLIVADQTQGNTSRIIGTFGYMAPEYVIHGQFSVKSDVYSFGVIVLEIVSGQRNNRVHNGEEDVEDLVSNVWRSWQEGSVLNIVDPSLKSGSKIEMERCIHIGLLCVQEDSNKRPTMAEILLMLNSNTITLSRPSKPAFLINNQTKSNMSLQWTDNSRGKKSLIYSSLQEGNSIQMSFNDDSSELYPR